MESRIRDLCRRAQDADRDAACELLEICHPDLFAYLRRLCGSRQDAEDLTQQTFLKVWSSLDRFGGRSTFSTWLYTIAHNTYVDWRRMSARGAQDYPDPWWDECVDANPGPYVRAADRQTAQRLYAAVDRLDEEQRHVVHLHYYQQLSIRQTAQVLNVAASTVKNRLHEALRILKATLDAAEDGRGRARTTPLAQGETT